MLPFIVFVTPHRALLNIINHQNKYEVIRLYTSVINFLSGFIVPKVNPVRPTASKPVPNRMSGDNGKVEELTNQISEFKVR